MICTIICYLRKLGDSNAISWLSMMFLLMSKTYIGWKKFSVHLHWRVFGIFWNTLEGIYSSMLLPPPTFICKPRFSLNPGAFGIVSSFLFHKFIKYMSHVYNCISDKIILGWKMFISYILHVLELYIWEEYWLCICNL